MIHAGKVGQTKAPLVWSKYDLRRSQKMDYEVRVLSAADEAVLGNVAPGVLDRGIDWRLTRAFLADPRHHMVVAVEAGVVVGFASGVHYIHPDKPAQMFINEVGVTPRHRGHGIGRAVVERIVKLASDLGCTEAWVLTDSENAAATKMYERAGGRRERSQEMFTFTIEQ